MASQDKETEILKIIEALTTTGKKQLDDDLMKKLKSICKLSDVYVNYTYYALMTQLRKGHSEIRYSALLITNELFYRSSAFRKLLELDLDEFMQLVVETDLDNPLPLPKPAAKELKIKGLEFMQNWCTKFGEKYTRLQLAVTYLKKCKKVDFNDMQARSIAQRERERQEQEHMDRVIYEKVEKTKKEMQELRNEISGVVTQMENCFRLLIPHPMDFFSPLDFENAETACSNRITDTNVDNSNPGALETDASFSENEPEICNNENSLRQHGLYDMKNTITVELKRDPTVVVQTNEDTLPIIENLNDLHKQVTTSYLPTISKWTKILTKGNNCSDFLKQAIDLRQVLESSLEKYKELKIKPNVSEATEDEEDDDFEEVKDKEGYEAEPQKEVSLSEQSFAESSCSKNGSKVDSSSWQLKYHDDLQDPTSAALSINKIIKKYQSELPAQKSSKQEKDKDNHKAKLLEKAPVLPYDIDLYHWEDEDPQIPEIIRYDSLHKFWETKDDDDNENETLKEVQKASLRTRKIDFSGKFEPVRWSCRAPLPNGKLCPRKDRYKCPFHGKIIKRDPLGNPVDVNVNEVASTSQSSTSGLPDWQDPELLGDIEAATGINLKIPQKGKKGKKKVKGKKKKSGLTNIKTVNNSVRERLSKKILRRYKHYARKLDDMERKKFNDKFGDQWNYY